jgi:hypothetical protein
VFFFFLIRATIARLIPWQGDEAHAFVHDRTTPRLCEVCKHTHTRRKKEKDTSFDLRGIDELEKKKLRIIDLTRALHGGPTYNEHK